MFIVLKILTSCLKNQQKPFKVVLPITETFCWNFNKTAI